MVEYRPWTWKAPETSKDMSRTMNRQDAFERVSGQAVFTRDVISLFRYTNISSPIASAPPSVSPATCRSARRHTARATCRCAAVRLPPGRINRFNGGNCAVAASIDQRAKHEHFETAPHVSVRHPGYEEPRAAKDQQEIRK